MGLNDKQSLKTDGAYNRQVGFIDRWSLLWTCGVYIKTMTGIMMWICIFYGNIKYIADNNATRSNWSRRDVKYVSFLTHIPIINDNYRLPIFQWTTIALNLSTSVAEKALYTDRWKDVNPSISEGRLYSHNDTISENRVSSVLPAYSAETAEPPHKHHDLS